VDDGSGKGGGRRGRLVGKPVVPASEHARQLIGAGEAIRGSCQGRVRPQAALGKQYKSPMANNTKLFSKMNDPTQKES
jgi:hypothetical protein